MLENKEKKRSGYIAVLEGADGSGKTTISKKVVEILKKYNLDVEWYRGPGGTTFGERMRSSMFDDGLGTEPANFSMMLAMMASHAEMTYSVMIPAKEAGKIIILDRYVESTMSYQGNTPEMYACIDSIIKSMVHDKLVDKTFIIDIPVSVMMERKAGRGIDNFLDDKPEKFYEDIQKRLVHRSYELQRRGQIVERVNNNVTEAQTDTIARDIAHGIMSAYLNQ